MTTTVGNTKDAVEKLNKAIDASAKNIQDSTEKVTQFMGLVDNVASNATDTSEINKMLKESGLPGIGSNPNQHQLSVSLMKYVSAQLKKANDNVMNQQPAQTPVPEVSMSVMKDCSLNTILKIGICSLVVQHIRDFGRGTGSSSF